MQTEPRPVLAGAIRTGQRQEHPSFLTARHLCCTRPPDCHVCRSQHRIKRDRRTLFQRRALVATRSGASTAILDPRSSADRTQDALTHGPPRTGPKTHLCGSSQRLFQPHQPTWSFAGVISFGGPSPGCLRLQTLLTTHQPSPLTSAGQHHHAGSFPRHFDAT